jgi:hypothetical protein
MPEWKQHIIKKNDKITHDHHRYQSTQDSEQSDISNVFKEILLFESVASPKDDGREDEVEESFPAEGNGLTSHEQEYDSADCTQKDSYT